MEHEFGVQPYYWSSRGWIREQRTIANKPPVAGPELPLGHGTGIYILATEAINSIPAHQFYLRGYKIYWDQSALGLELKNNKDFVFTLVSRLALAVYWEIAVTRIKDLHEYRFRPDVYIEPWLSPHPSPGRSTFCKEELKLVDYLSTKKFDRAWLEFENLSSFILKAKWKAIFELVLELLLRETETGILQYPTPGQVFYLPGVVRTSELGTPYLFTGFFCLRENYVYTGSSSVTDLRKCFWSGIGQE
jgi:hypothetical protein